MNGQDSDVPINVGRPFDFVDGDDYHLNWIRANGGKHPSEWQRLPRAIFDGLDFLVGEVTVTRDGEDHFIPLPVTAK